MKQYLLKVWMTAALSLLVVGGVWGQESYTPGYPNVSDITHESAKLNVSASVGGGNNRRPTHYALFVVLESTDTAPEIQDVIDWTDDANSGAILAGRYGEIGLSAPDTEFSIEAFGLDAETAYVVYIVTTENDYETVVIETTEPTAVPFTTTAAPTPLTATLSPENGATNVPVNTTEFVLTFDEDIELVGADKYAKLFIKDEQYSSRVVELNPTMIDGNTLNLSFGSNILSYETEYEITIPTDAIKARNSSKVFPGIDRNKWSFKVQAKPVPPVVVENGYLPASGAIEVPIKGSLTLTFNKDVEFGVNNELFLIYRDEGQPRSFIVSGEHVSISEDNRELIVDLSGSPLDYETEYFVVIEEGFVRSVSDGAPYEGIKAIENTPISGQVWHFKTESRPPFWYDGYPKISNMSASGFTLEVHADFPGMVYGVITMSSEAPSPEFISEGKNQNGDEVEWEFNEDIKDKDNPTSIDVNGFTETEGVYYLHVVYKREVTDELSKFGEVRTLVIDKIAPKIYSTYPINEFLAFPSDGKLLVTFSERVVDLQGNALSTEDFALYRVGEEDLKESISFTIDNTVISERTRITITPNEELTPLNSYELIIRKVKDLSGNTSESDSTTVSFETDGEFTWTGMGDVTVWEDPDNWGGTYIAGKSVRIPDGLSKYPIIQDGGNVRLHNLTVEAGGLLTQKGGTLNLTGEFHLESAADKVNASYIFTGGTLKVDADKVFVHQYIPVKDLSRVYFMGSPTLGANPINSGSGYQMRWFENQTDMWHNNGINNMTPGVGYAVYTLNNLLLCGAINTESILVKLYRTNGKGYGWNFLGNPFTSALSWEKLIDANSGIEDYIENNYWLWDPKDAIYNAFNQESGVGIGGADGTIPSNHGFLVKVKIGKTGAELTIPRSAQVENKSNFLKSTSVKPNHLKLRVGNGEYADELAVVFIDEANDGIDKFDTEKRFGDGKNPFEIYTINSSTSLSINTVPYVKNKEVGLGFVARKSGTYTIDLSELNLSGVDVILKDNLASNEINLLKDGPYTFSVNTTGTNNSRFVLKFTDSVITSAKPVELSDDELNLSYLVDNGNLYVSVVDSMIGEKYSLFDISGRVVKSDVLDTAGMVNIGRYPDGVYILTLYSNKGENTISKKIVVK